MKTLLAILAAALGFYASQTKAQSVLFDFDNAPLHSPFPIDLTVSGITAHFSANPAYYNYSIQRADVLGFTPQGFAGFCIYPSQVYLCDLLIAFNQPMTAASILYAPEEYATDSSCTMRITAYMGTTFIGTATYTIPVPGTWPTGTLAITTTQPFDNVVIHYDAPPPTGGDYGPIFMADNLWVTPAAAAGSAQRCVAEKPWRRRRIRCRSSDDADCWGSNVRTGGGTSDYQVVVTFAGAVTVNGTPQAQITLGIGDIGTGGVSNGGVVTVSGSTVTIPLTNLANARTIGVTLFGVTVDGGIG